MKAPVLISKAGRVYPGVPNPFIRRLFSRLFRAAKPVRRMSL